MRKRILIVGLFVVVIGVALVAGGFVLVVQPFAPGTGVLPSQKTTVTLSPGGNVTVGATQSDKIMVVEYTDGANQPLLALTGEGAAITRTSSSGGGVAFILVVTAIGVPPQSVALVDNTTQPLSVEYAVANTNLGALASAGLLIFGGGIMFIAGVVVVIVGAVLKKKPLQRGQATGP